MGIIQRNGNNKDDMIKITGLSKKKDKYGQTFLIGSLNALSQILILPNTHKEQETQPDYFFYIRVNPHAYDFDSAKPKSINV